MFLKMRKFNFASFWYRDGYASTSHPRKVLCSECFKICFLTASTAKLTLEIMETFGYGAAAEEVMARR